MNTNEIERLARAVNQLRPDWPVPSLITGICNDLAGRAYRDAAVALAWIACDPETKTPKRVTEDGPWWRATTPGPATEASRHTSAVPIDDLCHHCGRSPAHCHDPKVQGADPHEYAPPIPEPIPIRAKVYQRGAAACRAALPKLLDPDCKAGKHRSCIGGPCECHCHTEEPT